MQKREYLTHIEKTFFWKTVLVDFYYMLHQSLCTNPEEMKQSPACLLFPEWDADLSLHCNANQSKLRDVRNAYKAIITAKNRCRVQMYRFIFKGTWTDYYFWGRRGWQKIIGKLLDTMFKKTSKILFQAVMYHNVPHNFLLRKLSKKERKCSETSPQLHVPNWSVGNNLQGEDSGCGQAEESHGFRTEQPLQRGPCGEATRANAYSTAQKEKQDVKASPLALQGSKKGCQGPEGNRKKWKQLAKTILVANCVDSSSNTLFLFIVFKISGGKGKQECCYETLNIYHKYNTCCPTLGMAW